MTMWEVVYYLSIVAFLAAAIIGAGFFARAYMAGTAPMDAVSALFAPKPERRLDIVEQSNLDGRRRLILIRRDDVEHLIMTGGPVDMVIETGIAPPTDLRPRMASSAVDPPVFSTGSRSRAALGPEK
jgi:flagellar protein FliO/FliZ